jgi:hypothetical protein
VRFYQSYTKKPRVSSINLPFKAHLSVFAAIRPREPAVAAGSSCAAKSQRIEKAPVSAAGFL